ncbi:MAG TPA: tRNA (adenosine(37)-N6)-threonylcarbamoyltransferase complex dimerization subunit type 1 TsaB [Candidatus Hydrogenedentes bacterium]|jgi:tRNA threonylcarbamoyladenosine biosynthesis protein TsaB|nr:tRNA (adenosine(37)-N6)-threonylcarbamoyltransferase complex dimerization subunit type 1 TsaB [Candidatus Hydrogenedentota bacterium]HPJ99930.1 tRNA (adenosine(37)-N6)-threonylcarbamoyltransferase complex dimerization subunit type 1 TsaB [Candidatus Hydrogenedentota bacterium]
MIIVAGDTSTRTNTVAVCNDDLILAETVVDCGRTHAERLLDTITWALDEAGVPLTEVNVLAISTGPGSFTGLRVGLAAWKGLAFGLGIPLVGVPTLAAMSRLPGMDNGVCCPMLDARMGEVFAAAYRFESGARSPVLADCVAPVEKVAEALRAYGSVTLFGDGTGVYDARIRASLPGCRMLPRMFWAPRASAVAAEARDMLQAGWNTEAADVRPVYLRKSQAEQNRERAGHP